MASAAPTSGLSTEVVVTLVSDSLVESAATKLRALPKWYRCERGYSGRKYRSMVRNIQRNTNRHLRFFVQIVAKNSDEDVIGTSASKGQKRHRNQATALRENQDVSEAIQ